MKNGRIECGGLLVRRNMIAVELMGVAWGTSEACGILTLFADAEVPLGFLQVSSAADGCKTMTLGVPGEQRDCCSRQVEKVRERYAPPEVTVLEPAAVLTLYGPHFGERVGLSQGVTEALCRAEVDVIALASSVNSISVLLHASDADRAREALRTRFHWPE